MTTWTNEDSIAAQAEGWDVFFEYPRGYDIERVHLAGEFATDLAAQMYVVAQAVLGSELHGKALQVSGRA